MDRLSRIFYRNRVIRYPLELSDVLRSMGLQEGARILGSYLRKSVFPIALKKSLVQADQGLFFPAHTPEAPIRLP